MLINPKFDYIFLGKLQITPLKFGAFRFYTLKFQKIDLTSKVWGCLDFTSYSLLDFEFYTLKF